MGFTYYFYSPHSVDELKLVLEKTDDAFEHLLEELEEHPYLKIQEKLLSSLANVIPSPILTELSFDDFAVEEGRILEMQKAFDSARSCLCLEDVPYLQANPFQVTWLKILVQFLGPSMVDTGSVVPVKNISDFALELKRVKDLLQMTENGVKEISPILVKKPFLPVEPLDFTLRDIYKEMERLKSQDRLTFIEASIESNEKMKKLFLVIKNNFQNDYPPTHVILQKSGLHPKDFGDFMERLKFLLKRN
ncbi:MAG: hypothetical protein ACOYL6_06760 [Bacteriovoracaceae bacterium]